MKRTVFIGLAALVCIVSIGCAKTWTEESAREKAFQNVQYHIDVSKYPTQDPDFHENKRAIKAGQQRVGGRFVTENPEPPIGYVVSKMDEKGRPTITMF